MKNRIISILLALFLLSGLCTLFSGCDSYESSSRSSKKDSGFRKKNSGIFAQSGGAADGSSHLSDEAPVAVAVTEAEFDTRSDMTVYWTENGAKYHLYEDCNHLNNAEDLYYGTVEQAVEAGKEDVCKTCAERFNNEHD
ncbi:MAG: hypothetical protein MJ085_00675 [Clostridia bacterium]|nr:hypothetical protein [Clostridia bacterium]